MLDLIEKIAHGMCALVVVVVGGLYLWWGTPDTEPEELLPRSIESDIPHPRSRGPDGDGPTAAATSPSKLLAEKRTIMTEVRKNNRSASGARFVHKYLQVQRPTFEYVRNEANWLRQLERIGREDLPPADKGDFTRMKLTHMPENSLLRKLGLRTNDTIELIDGERLSIDDSSTVHYRARARELLDKLENGEAVTVTVTRNGQPLHLEFTLP